MDELSKICWGNSTKYKKFFTPQKEQLDILLKQKNDIHAHLFSSN